MGPSELGVPSTRPSRSAAHPAAMAVQYAMSSLVGTVRPCPRESTRRGAEPVASFPPEKHPRPLLGLLHQPGGHLLGRDVRDLRLDVFGGHQPMDIARLCGPTVS